MRGILHFFYRRAEDVMVALTAAMFASFIIQIATRYVFNAPTEWTHEVILICWLWLVFWGAAFLLEDKDHVKFDVLYNMGSEKARRIMSLIVAVAFAVIFLFSAPATWSFISFKGIRSSDILGIPMNWIFFVYMLFLIGTIIHYALRAYRLARGDSLSTLEKEESL
ncbi:MAG: TRAP transporter small permease [Beijerinckiaceae bacterium]